MKKFLKALVGLVVLVAIAAGLFLYWPLFERAPPEPDNAEPVDVVLIGAGVMSVTLATYLQELEPDWRIEMYERLDGVSLESSDGWNNAGTGHSGFAELNYTPEREDGSIETARAVDIAEQFATTLTGETFAGVGELQQARTGFLQRFAILTGGRAAGICDVLGQLFQRSEHLAFGLQQQALRITGQFAGRQQLIGAEVAQLLKAWAQPGGQLLWQLFEGVVEGVDGLGRAAVLHGVATGQVGLNVVGHLALELLGQRQVALHQLHWLLQCALRPP